MFLEERPLPSLKDPHAHTLQSSLQRSMQSKVQNVSKSKSKNLQTKETMNKVKRKENFTKIQCQTKYEHVGKDVKTTKLRCCPKARKITKHDWNKGTSKTITQQDSKFKENKFQRTKIEVTQERSQ